MIVSAYLREQNRSGRECCIVYADLS